MTADTPKLELVDRLQVSLKNWLGVEVSQAFISAFRKQLRRVPSDLKEDFSSLVLLECAEMHRRGDSLDERSVIRVVDRIEKRLTRGESRQRHFGFTEAIAADSSQDKPTQTSTSELIRSFCKQLDPMEAVFLSLLVDRIPATEIQQQLGISRATYYRRRDHLRRLIRELA